MRTTVNIDDGLLETVKRRAQERRTTLGDVLEQALRDYVMRPDPDPSKAPELPVFRAGGLRPGIDPTSNASLFEAVGDEDEDFAHLRSDSAS